MNPTGWAGKAHKFIDELRACDDPDDRFELIIEFGETLDPLPEEEKTEANRVQGCTAKVWLVPEVVGGKPTRIRFRADSDSPMVRGLAALLLSQVNEKPCDEVASFDFRKLADEFSLHQYLSPSRSNGLFAMSKRLGRLAAACGEGGATDVN